MRRRIICAMLTATVVSLLPLSVSSASGQTATGNLLEQRVTLHVKRSTFMYALSTLCVDYGFRLGLSSRSVTKRSIS